MSVRNKYLTTANKEFTWNGVTKTGQEWADFFEITIHSFNYRIASYGETDKRTFFNKEQMKEYIRQCKIQAGKAGGTKAREMHKVNKKRKKMCKPLDPTELAKDPSQVQAMHNLIADMVNDAKVNLKIKSTKNLSQQLLSDSRRWLMNGNGGLKYMLEYVPGINAEKALEALYEYATRN